MKFQLVVQFPSVSVSFDELVEIEDLLCETIQGSSDIDGHDFGSGEGNIFIRTDDPHSIFREVHDTLPPKYLGAMKAAYRPVAGGDYIPV